MNPIEKTIDFHQNGGLTCSQAILAAFGERFGLDQKTARLLGRPWAGGIGHLAETCGYLTGAVIVLAQAFDCENEKEARKKTLDAVRELFRRFEERRGTTRCKELLGADMNTEEGQKKIKEGQLVAKNCQGLRGIGKDVAEILDELLCMYI